MRSIKLILDEKGSSMAECNHYVFGQVGSELSGGVYIKKTVPQPNEITFKYERESDNAKC
jgi:hypothetical protein